MTFYWTPTAKCLKSKGPCILLDKNINFYKSETGLKMESPHTALCISSYKNHKLKLKLWWVGACERKKRVFFVPFILSKKNCFNICVLSQCIVYWIYFQNIHTFTYQKTLLHTLFSLFLKSSKTYSVSLKNSKPQSKFFLTLFLCFYK